MKKHQHILSYAQNLLASLTHQAEQYHHLESILLPLLPQNLQSNCRVVQLQHHTLVMQTTNASWATQIRLRTPTLIEALKDHGIIVKQLKCLVEPEA